MIRDIRIDVRWKNHPKRAKLTMLLGHDATGYVLDLWISAAQSKPNGVLRDLDDMDIALMAGWRGNNPQDFISALCAVRLLERDEAQGCYVLHDWAEHQPWVIGEPARVEAARKAAHARHHGPKNGPAKDVSKDAAGDGPVVPVARKMPEVGSKSGENMRCACAPHAPGMRTACGPDADSNAPLQCLSSPKGIKTPPERADALSTPMGGERQPAKRFVPPTVDEIAAYCAERGNGIDPQAIHDHYTANGWKVGKNPMRDWKAAVRTWESRRRQEQRERATAAVTSPAARLLAQGSEAGGQPQ